MTNDSTKRRFTLKWDHEYQYTDGVPASVIVATGNEIDEHEVLEVVEYDASREQALAEAKSLLALAGSVYAESSNYCERVNKWIEKYGELIK